MVNEKTLTVIADSNETARSIFEHFASRQRFHTETSLKQLRLDLMQEGKKVIESEFNEIFKKFEAMGMGSTVTGRAGRPNRFKWNYNLRELAKSVKAKPKKVIKVAAPVVPSNVVKTAEPVNLVIPVSGLSKEDIKALIDLLANKPK